MFKTPFKPLIIFNLPYKTIPKNNHLSEYLNGLLHIVPALFILVRKQCTRRQVHLKPLARFLNEPISSLPGLPAVFWGYCFRPEHGRQRSLPALNAGHSYWQQGKIGDNRRPPSFLSAHTEGCFSTLQASITQILSACEPSSYFVFHEGFPCSRSLKNQEADDTILFH